MNLIFLDIDGVLNRQPENPRKEWKDFHARPKWCSCMERYAI